ncbi:flagellar hook-basal body protein [Fodinisporobacter ferrooxydans]|uniref:Flagellar hook-basal body protein n=1 Tax=Fodinisporobacter ferrooxydans TaxID=2901836 RepID=A0ABY4CLZ7_9BACL|nr:flagellar hook-basal body protein [Alicyclobacillaceae bacterium MYW30-H2]
MKEETEKANRRKRQIYGKSEPKNEIESRVIRMIRGLYTAASGMIANQRLQEVISNNLANADTPGYKAQDGELMAFPEQLMERINYGRGLNMNSAAPNPIVGKMGTGVWLQETLSRFTEGPLQKSDKPYDYGIVDAPLHTSFFAVNEPNVGPILTRDGHFVKDADNLLVTASGQRLLAIDSKGNPVPNSGIQVQPDGTTAAVQVDGNGQPTNKPLLDGRGQPLQVSNSVAVVDVANPNQLVPYGDNGYTYGNAALQPGTADVRHGFIEQSNVDPTQTMVSMINVMRSYEANSKVIHTIDLSMDKAVNEIGRVV